MKTCQSCGREHGARKLVCECGFDFKKKATSLIPEPGAWVVNEQRGMPKIQSPEPYEDGPITTATIKEQVLYEGLGYCIYSWIPADRIKDKKLAKMFADAREKMQAIHKYLNL